MMSTLRILFNTKFCQTHLDSLISEYWEKSFDEKTDTVIFDLSLIEWINIEEIAFLFAWIRNINNENKKVEVWMPHPYNIFDTQLYQNPDELKKVKSFLNTDDTERVNRRKKRSIFLLGVWEILERTGVKAAHFKYTVDGPKYKADEVRGLFSHLVIPFTVISSQKPSSQISNTFRDLINGSKTKNEVEKKPVAPFDLSPTIIDRLETFNCYTPFESKIISHVITKELFANSLIHSNISNKNDGIEECYFALALHNQWDDFKAKGGNFLNQFILEKDGDTLDFYKDKTEILKEIKTKLESSTPSETLLSKYKTPEEADLKNFQNKPQYFKNKSFLEFTFLDFGDGIYNTLEKKFKDYIELEENQNTFKTTKAETQILEYAFYSESSRNQYDARLEHPELFPRGLYFLVDMVRRYKGLLVVRSGEGKIVYDFSDKINLKKQGKKIVPFLEPITTVREAIRNIKSKNAHFEGTLVSIVLPEKKKEDLSYEPVRADNKELYKDIYLSKTDTENLPSEIFKPESYEYINMLFLYEKVITTIKPKELEKTKGFDSYIYIELLSELKKHSTKKCIIFIDFEFYPRTDNIQQLLFYLTNSPYINEYSKAVIINLVDEKTIKDKELQKDVYSVLSEFKVNLFAKDNEPHIFRPIPCVNFDLYETEKLVIKNINWIGVKSVEDEKQLDKLFIGETFQIKTKHLINNESLGGSVFADNSDFKYAIFTTSLHLTEKFKEARQTAITKLVNTLITDGTKPIKNYKEKGIKEHFIFQASNGSFQVKYLSLYEALHNKYLAKYLAKRLLDNFIAKIKDKTKFNKIITVTVSSQLIGVAIRDLIKEDPAYKFLKTGDDDTMESCPSLIMLSSYYSFEDEKPFTKIKDADNVLIVNDVISTGSLVYKLIEKTRKKGAIVKGVMSITDCRIEKADKEEEDDCEFELLKDEPLFTLVGYPAQDIEIRKYKEKDFAIKALNKACNKNLDESGIDVKRINPLLNTVVELSDEYAEKQRILFEDPKDLLPKDGGLKNYQHNFFKIGHFEQNISHNGYLTNMKLLFSDNEGYRIIKEIKEKIDSEYQTKLYNRNIDDATKLFSIISLAEQIENKEMAGLISIDIRNKLQLLINEPTKPHSNKFSYKPDFIFYPIFSGIENFSHKQFHEIFNTDYENIIGLQRFDTDKGWRFPFPPKRFNNITKGKHILIFDSGALTGESLVQMIDSISFLDVAKIDVISVVGRIEDYNREFFSRIKSLKVKTLHDDYFEESYVQLENKKEIQKNKISFSNLNIIFGVNFHIPVFSSKSSCPFCEELAQLESYQERYSQDFPTATKSYIDKRIMDIKRIDLNHEPNSPTPNYIPHVKSIIDTNAKAETKEYDIVSLFLMRDKLGKIDSYRFYKEYYKPFDDDIIKHLEKDVYEQSVEMKEVLRQIELVLICILHEPKLFKVHKDLLVNIHNKCKTILEDIVIGRKSLTVFHHKWSKYSILNLVWLFHSDSFYNLDFLETLLSFASDDDDALSFISFQIFKTFDSSKLIDKKEKCVKLLLALSHKFEYESTTYFLTCPKVRPIITDLITYLEPTEIKSLNDAFYNLRIFFENRHPDNKHNQLKEKISYLRSRIKNRLVSEIEEMTITAQGIISILKEEILDALNKIKEVKLFKTIPEFESNLLFGEDSVSIKLVKIILNYETIIRQDEYQDENEIFFLLSQFTYAVVNFQFEFFKGNSPFYKFCKNFPCDLNKVIGEAWDDVTTNENNSYNVAISNQIENDTYVNIHKAYFNYALIELLNNAIKESENKDAIISFSAVKSDSSLKLIIHQNKPYVIKHNSRKGGIEKYIIPLFEQFCGYDKLNFIKSEAEFIIEIDFSNPIIENY